MHKRELYGHSMLNVNKLVGKQILELFFYFPMDKEMGDKKLS
jgi:hypothetical protein